MAGYTTPAWSNDQSPAIDDSALLDIGHGIEIAEHPYGVCSTAAATAAKEVTIDYSGTLTLFTGLTVRVKFSNANGAENPTLNVNGTGAAPITQYGATAIPKNTTWPAGSVVTFVYDGANWIMQSLPQMAGLIWDGIGIPNTDDLNNYVNTGWYYYNTAPTNAPVTTSYCGLHVERCGPNIRQTVYRGSYGNPDAPAEWVRYKYSTSAWTPWVQQVTQMLAADLTLHVDAVNGNDSNDGLTAATALKTIAAALAKIPADQAGHYAQILLANGTYSALSISNRNLSVLLFGRETGATADNIKIPGGTITDNGNGCIMLSNVTFTATLSLYGHNRLTQFIVSSCVFDGGGLDTRGPFARINSCSFKNMPSNYAALNIGSGYAEVYALNIASSCDIGINAAGATVIVNTNTLTNNATTPYRTTYSGRIFVGGRTYQESPQVESIYYSSTPYSITGGNVDLSLTHPMNMYESIIMYLTTSSTNSSSNRCMVRFNPWELGASAWYTFTTNGTNFYAVRIGFASSGNYSMLRIVGTSAPNLYAVQIVGVCK